MEGFLLCLGLCGLIYYGGENIVRHLEESYNEEKKG